MQTRLVLLSTYPPRECGIATFSRDFVRSLQSLAGNTLVTHVAAMDHSRFDTLRYPPEVRWRIREDVIDDYRELALRLNETPDVAAVLIEHEYGIFGGTWGSHLLAFLDTVKVPVITLFHSVLSQPEPAARAVTQRIIERSAASVVMSEDSKKLLETIYQLPPGHPVRVIPHGIHPVLFRPSRRTKRRLGYDGRTILTTFGLLSRNKGIEYVLEALPEIIADYPDLLYLVVGMTHPVVRRREGEQYRLELMALVEKLGIEQHVRFVDEFVPLNDLLAYLQATDIYVATSLDPDQSVSGTFSYALGCGRAVVATDFRQARGMLDQTMGAIVPMRDPAAFARALRALLGDTTRLASMHETAYRKTRTMLWSNVAHEYTHLFGDVLQVNNPAALYLPPLKLDHLFRMTEGEGIVQFARRATPDLSSGYTADDTARALIVVHALYRRGYIPCERYVELALRFLGFLEKCRQQNGTFLNYVAAPGASDAVTRQNGLENLEDTQGRIMWAAADLLADGPLSFERHSISLRATALLEGLVPQASQLHFIRAAAFALFGLCSIDCRSEDPGSFPYRETVVLLANKLTQPFRLQATASWQWFEPSLTYANGILPAACLRAGRTLRDQELVKIGLDSLDFLTQHTFMGNVYVPIGQNGWSSQNGRRALFDQQPEDVYHMSLALSEAFTTTGNPFYKERLQKCFSWFLGNNLLGRVVYNRKTGGCFDGLTERGPNENQGAESLLSYLLARLYVETVE